MAITLLKRGNGYSMAVCEFAVDTVGEMSYLPCTTRAGIGVLKNKPGFEYSVSAGSICHCGNGNVYRLFTNGWVKCVNANSGSGGDVSGDVTYEPISDDVIENWFDDDDSNDDVDGGDNNSGDNNAPDGYEPIPDNVIDSWFDD